MSGAYVPLTTEGNIIADGILASCYAITDHYLAHVTMTPIRWFPEMIQWMSGEINGSEAYVKIAKYMGKWMLPEEQY